MKTKWLLSILVLVVLIFFQAHFISDVYLAIGDSLESGKKMDFYKLSHRVFPFEHTAAYESGHVLLEAGYENKNNTALQAGILWFKKAAARNPLHYYSHYYLAKSYLFYNYPHSRFFNEAVSEFKKAAIIRGSNKMVTLDTCKILLSLWPFLNDTDKQFCKNLLTRSIEHFLPGDFAGIVEPWWLYSKDRDFLEQILEKKPVFYFSTAEKLKDLEAPLPLRWELLAKYENFLLDEVHRLYQPLALQKQYQPGALLPLLEKLNSITFYYKPAGYETFNQKKYDTLKNKILNDVISSFFDQPPGKSDQKTGSEKAVEYYISQYITGNLPKDRLLSFKEELKKKGFFRQDDFASLYFNYLLEFQLGNFSGVISGIERLKDSLGYINLERGEQRARYIQLLLLLADAYESSKLLSAARESLIEILGIEPNNLDASFRLLRIQQVVGKDKESWEKIKENLPALDNSRIFELNSIPAEIKKTVYLIGTNRLEITVADQLKEEIKTTQTCFLQVFVDAQINYESHISLFPGAVFQVEIKPLPGITGMAQHQVEVVVRR